MLPHSARWAAPAAIAPHRHDGHAGHRARSPTPEREERRGAGAEQDSATPSPPGRSVSSGGASPWPSVPRDSLPASPGGPAHRTGRVLPELPPAPRSMCPHLAGQKRPPPLRDGLFAPCFLPAAPQAYAIGCAAAPLTAQDTLAHEPSLWRRRSAPPCPRPSRGWPFYWLGPMPVGSQRNLRPSRQAKPAAASPACRDQAVAMKAGGRERSKATDVTPGTPSASTRSACSTACERQKP